MLSPDPLPFCGDLGAYGYSEGAFFVYRPKTGHRGNEVHPCREVLHWSFNKPAMRHLGLCGLAIDYVRLNVFWEALERRLGITEPTVLYRLRYVDSYWDVPKRGQMVPQAVVLHLSPWWTETSLRRGMASLFLRAGACYFKTDVVKAMERYPRASDIMPAVRRFLSGHTVLGLKRLTPGGVCATLRRRDEAALTKVLIKP